MFVKLSKDWLSHKAGTVLDFEDEVGNVLVSNGTGVECNNHPVQLQIQETFGEFVQNFTKSLSEQMDTVLKNFADEAAKSRRNVLPAIFGEGGNGDPNKTFGAFLLAIRRGDTKFLESAGSRFVDWEDTKATDLTTQEGASGGFTVPTQFIGRLLQIAADTSIVEQRATRIPMGSKVVEIPTLDITTTPTAGDTAFFGGLNARWTEEAAAITQDEPVFKQVKLEAHELSGYTVASNTLMADNGIGLEAVLLNLFGRAIGWHKDYAFLRGTGAGKPLGVLNANALISVSRSAASAFALEDAANMLARLLPGWTPRTTVWAIHPTVLVPLLQMTASSIGGNTVFIDNARDRPRMVLFGIPVETTEKLPALNTLGEVLLLDLQHYLVGDRQQVEIAFSEHVKFLTNQGTWRFVSRSDGQPWIREKVTLSDATSTLSPFVALVAA